MSAREDYSMGLAQERHDAEVEARQSEALEEVADGLWANEPDPYARYDTDPVPLSRALDDVLEQLHARHHGEAAVVVLAVAADAGSVLVGLVVLLAVSGVVAAMVADSDRKRRGIR